MKGIFAARKFDEYAAVAFENSPYIYVYPWTSGTGFGTKYADPATLPTGFGYVVAFNRSQVTQEIAIGHNASPRITVYPWSSSGFGTKYANPATVPGFGVVAVNWRLDCKAIGMIDLVKPVAYEWTLGSGFGTKFADPAVLPGSIGLARHGYPVSYDGTNFLTSDQNSPYIIAYPFNQTSFGTKYANPASLPTISTYGIAWSRDNRNVFVGQESTTTGGVTTMYPAAYKFTNSGFGTKYANSSNWSTSMAIIQTMTHGGSHVAGTFGNASPYIRVFPFDFDNGFGTVISDPGATFATESVNFNRSGDTIFGTRGSFGTDGVGAYPWSTSGYGTKYADPATGPTVQVSSVATNLWG